MRRLEHLEDLGRAAKRQRPLGDFMSLELEWPRPLSDHVLVEDLGPVDRPVSEGGRTGAILWQAPDWKEVPREGRVLAVGPGHWAEDEDGNLLEYRVPLSVKPGDRVLYGRYAGRRTWIRDTGGPAGFPLEFTVMEESSIFGLLD